MPLCYTAGFETMSAAQSSTLEEASSVASRDQASLDQVQQTAATGQAHVQGKLLILSALDEAFAQCKAVCYTSPFLISCQSLTGLCLRILTQPFPAHQCFA